MLDHQLAAGIVALRPFLPAKDFQISKNFYTDLGFEVVPLGDKLASVSIGRFAFLLQDYFVQDWADNFVMHMQVTNLDRWWEAVSRLGLEARYQVRAPRPPKLEPWGLRVAYLFDPAGVLWHFAEDT
jgi:catechol 2,3-dioxygenase-like lactoylglutathione lyase family enzyme